MKNFVAIVVAVLSLVVLSGCAGSMPDAKYVALENEIANLKKELKANKAGAAAAADETEDSSEEEPTGAATVVVQEIQGFLAKPRDCSSGNLMKIEGRKGKFTIMEVDGLHLGIYNGPTKVGDAISPLMTIWVCLIDTPYAETGTHVLSGTYYTRQLNGVVDLDAPSGTFHFTGGYNPDVTDFHLIQLGQGMTTVNIP
jgi:hypothetical protein